ncbi:hypothetical protein JCM3770_000698, partial [Rhodotorula araucariae]
MLKEEYGIKDLSKRAYLEDVLLQERVRATETEQQVTSPTNFSIAASAPPPGAARRPPAAASRPRLLDRHVVQERGRPARHRACGGRCDAPVTPAALPADSHARGSENYEVWCIQIRGLVGPDAYRVMTGELTRHRPAPLTSAGWARLNDFAVSSLVISCAASVIHHVQDIPGSLRLLTRFWGLSLPVASPEAFDAIAKDYRVMLAALRVAKVNLDMVYSSHLFAALPSSLTALQTTIAVANHAPAGGSIALAAGAADPWPPSPCPACKANHWLRVCPKRDEYRAARRGSRKAASAQVATAAAPRPAAAPAGALATLLD